jgi:uncharacterized coiled-coil DUF342 family protein
MQLKSIGETERVSKSIDKIVNSVGDLSKLGSDKNTEFLSSMVQSLNGVSIKSTKSILGLKNLDDATVKNILSQKGLKGEMLESAVAEVQQAASINATTMAEKAGAVATSTYGDAFAGLGTKIKEASIAFLKSPFGIATLTVAGIILINSAVQSFNETLDQQKEKLEETKEQISGYDSEITDLQGKLDENQKKITEINSNKLDIVDEKTLSTLQLENQQLKQQLQTVKELKEEAKKKEQGKTLDILNNTAKATNYTKIFNKIKSGDMFNPTEYFENIKTSDMGIGGLYNAKDKLGKKDFVGAGKSILNAVTPLGFLDSFVPKQENEKDIFQQTQEQIKAVSTAREKLALLDEKGKDLSAGDYQKAFTEINAELTKGNTGLTENIASLQKYKDSLDASNPSQKRYIDGIQKTIDAYTASLAKDKNYNTFEKVLDSDVYGGDKDELIGLAQKNQLTPDVLKNKFHNVNILFNALGLGFDDVNKKLKQIGDKNDKIKVNKVKVPVSEALNSADLTETKSKLLELAKAGELTPETLKSVKDYKKLMDETGLSVSNVVDGVLSLLDANEKLAAFTKGTSSIKSAYSEYSDKGFVSAETLEGMRSKYSNLKSYNVFEQLAGDPNSGKKKIQDAFNDLITDYTRTQETLVGVTEKNKGRYIANLKEAGVSNAEQVVNGQIAVNDKYSKLLNDAETKYDSYLNNKGLSTAEFNNKIAGLNAQLVMAMGKGYASDIQNWLDLLKQKAVAYNQFAASINKAGQQNLDINDVNAYAKNSKSASDIANAYGKYSRYQKAGSDANKLADKLKLKMNKVNTNYSANYSPSSGSKSGSGGKSAAQKDTKDYFDYIEIRLKRLQEKADRVSTKMSSTFRTLAERLKDTWKSGKNNDEMNYLENMYKTNESAAKKYQKQANSVKVSKSIKSKIQDGSINISKYSSSTQSKIKEYQEWYEKMLSCKDALEGIKQKEADLVKARFDAIQTDWANKVDVLNQSKTVLDNAISIQQESGHAISSAYYTQLYNNEKNVKSKLLAERKDLQSKLDNAVKNKKITKGSEAWYEMKKNIDGVTNSISEADKALITYQNNIRQLKWDAYTRLQDTISDTVDETETLINLLGSHELTDKDEYGLTDYGTATMGVDYANYLTYQAQAQKALTEMNRTKNEDLAKDPNDQNAIDHLREITKQYHEYTSSMNDAKTKMIDLAKNGYDALMDKVQELIDKKKELMNTEKEEYDFQKSLTDKTDALYKLQMQLNAVSGDDSEEGKKRRLQLEKQVKDAKTDLKETQWEKQISETEKMLDKFSKDYQDFIDDKFKEVESAFKEIVNTTEENRDVISRKITETGMVVSDAVINAFNGNNSIAQNVSNNVANATQVAQNNQAQATQTQNNAQNVAQNTLQQNQKAEQKKEDMQAENVSRILASHLVKEKGKKKKEYSDLNQYLWEKTGGKTIHSKYFDDLAVALGLSKKSSTSSILTALKKLKRVNYASGGSSGLSGGSSGFVGGFATGGIGELVKPYGEDGMAFVRNGEGFVQPEHVPVIKDFLAATPKLEEITKNLAKVSVPSISGNSQGINQNNEINIQMNLPDVTDYEDFVSKIKSDKQFEKIIQSMTIAKINGGNSLTKYKY